MLVSKICLTGGPCAGKTTALVKIEQELTEKGYKVLIIDELATNYINRGIKPVGVDNISWYDFETMMLEAQVLKEKHYEKAAELIDKPCVIICDRGIFDIKSFIDDKTFNKILKTKKSYSERDLTNRWGFDGTKKGDYASLYDEDYDADDESDIDSDYDEDGKGRSK